MKYCKGVIGNSSSGIIEAPTFQVPTINIGDRQKGRVQANSTLNCAPEMAAIQQTIGHALSRAFQDRLVRISNPYERPHTCEAIIGVLKVADIYSVIKKVFYDIGDHYRHN